MISKHTLPYFVFPGIDFRRGQGIWPTKPKMTLHKHSIHPPQREATPFPPVPFTLTHPFTFPPDHNQNNWGIQSCSGLRTIRTCVQTWESSRLPWKGFPTSQTLYLWDEQTGLNLLCSQGLVFSASCLPPLPRGQCCWDHRCVYHNVWFTWRGELVYFTCPTHNLYNPKKLTMRPAAWWTKKDNTRPTWRPFPLVAQKTKGKNPKLKSEPVS